MRVPVERLHSALGEAALLEIAHLYCSWRLTRGATHALNNALTATAGLVDVAGAGEDLEREVDRCVRITRGLTEHHPLRFGQSRESELVAVVRGGIAILRETLGRRFELEPELADDFFCLDEDPARIELLLLTAAQRLTDQSQRGGRLRIAVAAGAKPHTASLELELVARDLPPDAAETLLDPGACPSDVQAIALEALERIAARCEASLSTRLLPDRLQVCAVFPTSEP